MGAEGRGDGWQGLAAINEPEGAYPHPCGLWGAAGGPAVGQAGGSSLGVPDPGYGGAGMQRSQAGSAELPMGVAGAGCQQQHLTPGE